MFASPGQLLIQHGAGAAALMAQQLSGNDPRLASLQGMFPAVDLITVNAIFANKFEAENLLRLDASFLHRKKKPAIMDVKRRSEPGPCPFTKRGRIPGV
jgi:hypothetical protein